jgi:hypothetical protein
MVQRSIPDEIDVQDLTHVIPGLFFAAPSLDPKGIKRNYFFSFRMLA